MSKIVCIGDPHGEYDKLRALFKTLAKNNLKPGENIFVVLGDLVDRGLKSKQVISYLMKLEEEYDNFIVLYGNHESLMLDALLYQGRIYHSYDLWWNQGGKETAYSYMPKKMTQYEKAIANPTQFIPKEHLSWLASRPKYYETDDYIFVHAGLRPGIELKDQDPQDLIWIRDEFILSHYNWGKKIIFGHTAIRRNDFTLALFEPIVMEHKIGIDTAACAPDGKLTAIVLPDEKFYFAP